MSEFCWDPTQLGAVFAVPTAVVQRHLKMAGAVQLKVLLWFSANGGMFDAAACAKALGLSAADCRDALQYWVETGLLRRDGEATPAPREAAPAPSVSVPSAPVVGRPVAVKPQMTEVVEAQKQSAEFAYLLNTVSSRLGRPLSPGDMETLLYLFRSAGLPVEVILMAVGYAAQAERFTIRYIEKVALDWADKGILTIDAAEKHLCYLEHCQQSLLKVQTVCGMTTPLTANTTNLAAAERWVFQWHLSDDLLREAYALCLRHTGKFNAKYMDRILENWREQGISSPDQLSPAGAQKTDSDRPNDYEQMVETYLPVYKKKRKKG